MAELVPASQFNPQDLLICSFRNKPNQFALRTGFIAYIVEQPKGVVDDGNIVDGTIIIAESVHGGERHFHVRESLQELIGTLEGRVNLRVKSE